jgi:hypothetical protein
MVATHCLATCLTDWIRRNTDDDLRYLARKLEPSVLLAVALLERQVMRPCS